MTTFLTYFTVVLAVIGLVQIVRIFELAAKLKGEQNLDEISDKENHFNAVAMLVVGMSFVLFVA